MTLLLEEFKDEALSQKITPTHNFNVEAIRPHLYKHNSPTGTLVLSICDSNGQLIAQSPPQLISAISTSPYFHGHVRFFVNAYLEAGVEYTISLSAQDGYVFDESAYCGFCKDFEFHNYPASYEPHTALNSPFDLQVWARSPR